MKDGCTADVATVGPEGFIGIDAAWGLARAGSDATVRIAGIGSGYALTVEAFRAEFGLRGAFFSAITNYFQAFVGSLVQSVACNALHSVEARSCRWLLDAQNRLATDELPLTHELLSTILGVRRPTVSLMLADLARLGILSSHRGVIRIIDRTGLEQRSCECYGTVSSLFDKLQQVYRESSQESFALTT